MQPTDGRKTQSFNTYPQASGEPWGHTGDDYAGNIGDLVRTIADGVVLFAGWSQDMPDSMADAYMFVRGSGNGGIMALIQHDGWCSLSAHLDSTPLNPGDTVTRGQVIGTVGTTGRSTGSHLHYECIEDGAVTNQPMFGRYDPALQIAHEDAVASTKASASMAPPATPTGGLLTMLTDAEQRELLTKVRTIFRHISGDQQTALAKRYAQVAREEAAKLPVKK
jgi:murein DD-endopeptidase MepM/ murein hydrolase activator NlpD